MLWKVIIEGSKGLATNSQVIVKPTLVALRGRRKASITVSIGLDCAYYVAITCASVITT